MRHKDDGPGAFPSRSFVRDFLSRQENEQKFRRTKKSDTIQAIVTSRPLQMIQVDYLYFYYPSSGIDDERKIGPIDEVDDPAFKTKEANVFKVFKEKIHDKYPAIDARFLFANSGFNFRPTEMEGAFGVVQFGRFKKYFQNRVELAEFYMKNFSLFSDFLETPAPKPKTICAWFAYPIMIRQDSPFTKKDFVYFAIEVAIILIY